MDDRGWQWPAWKFGMKREDLFTSLHDQYNTFPSTIQDPEAFHHDVWEISNTASTQDEFRAMLADRKELRLRELNQTLESASFEIIANPKLIGSEQWQFAVQLFRTRSLDSLVRYFASYLPDAHPWHHTHEDDAQTSTTVSSVFDSLADSVDTIDSVSTIDSGEPFFDDDDHDYLLHEPLSIHTSALPASHLPPSPRSMTMCSDSSAAVSPINPDHDDQVLGGLPALRTTTYADIDCDDAVMHSELPSQCDEDETSQDDDYDTPFSSVSDIADIAQSHSHGDSIAPAEHEELSSAVVESVEESETPTPRNELELKSYPLEEHSKPSTGPKASQQSSSPLYTQVLNEYMKSRKTRRDVSPARSIRRTSPEIGRIQKPLPDSIRTRPVGRRRND